VQLFDQQGRRLYLTYEERKAFLKRSGCTQSRAALTYMWFSQWHYYVFWSPWLKSTTGA